MSQELVKWLVIYTRMFEHPLVNGVFMGYTTHLAIY